MRKKLICGLLSLVLLLGSAQSMENGFSDVKPTDWFAPYVEVCVENGLMKGTGDGNFSPDGAISMAEAAAVAARLGSAYPSNPAIPQKEEGKPWYQPYVAYFSGLIGDSQLTRMLIVQPTRNATRLEFFYLLSAVIPAGELSPINAITSLPDTEDPQVLAFYNAGILTGVDKAGTFAGSSSLSRAETAAMIARLVQPELRLPFIPQAAPDSSAGSSTAGSSSSSSELPDQAAAMTVNGQPVSLSELANWVVAVAYQTDVVLSNQYGSRLDLSDADMAQAVLEQAQLQASAQVLMELQAAQLGCEVNSLAEALAPSPSQEELQSFVSDNGLLCAKHILVPDAQSAQAVLDGLKAQPNLAQFNALLQVFGTDPGMGANPDGYLFAPGEMVQEFETGTLALELGGYSPQPVQSSFGYHVIWRLNPLDHPDLLPEYRNFMLEQYVNRWLREAEISADNQVIAQLDLAATYSAYLSLLAAQQQG